MASHYALAKRFVGGATEGKGSRMFIEENAIFSYGKHFAICLRLPDNRFLFNTDKYSSSTSKHQRCVDNALYALENKEIINCGTSEIKRAIDYPNEPIIIKEQVMPSSVDECLGHIRRLYRDNGLNRVPVNKIKKLLNDWEMIRRI